MKTNAKKWIKVLSVIMVIITVVVIANSVYGAINEDYYNASKSEVVDVALDKKLSNNILVDALAYMIYAVASLFEWILGIIFKMVSNDQIFPWADAIVFNAIPMLDVNFMNPATGSFIGTIKDIIANVYGTVFALATTFFTIAVLVMAIKLATSVIASEKAKYKQAIWDWVVGLVLLFTIHIVISFVFYLNETLVNMASQIASKSIKDAGIESGITIQKSTVTPAEQVERFIKQNKAFTITDILWLGTNKLEETISNWGKDEAGAEAVLRANPEVAVALMGNEDYQRWRFGTTWVTGSDGFWEFANKTTKFTIAVAANVQDIITGNVALYEGIISNIEAKASSDRTAEDIKQLACMKVIMNVYRVHVKGETPNQVSIIANLAEYFKTNAWTVDKGWKATKPVIQNALLYAILTVQSLIFFIAYIKRLFYVVLLALMAPAVVVYDFMQKATKG